MNELILRWPQRSPRLSLLLAVLLWFGVYEALIPLSEAVVKALPVDRNGHLGGALQFFSYDTPTFLMLVNGTGCAKCKSTITVIEQVPQAKGVAVKIQKVEELRDIMSYGVMSTPGVVIDWKVVHTGGIPSRDKIEQWLDS